MISAGEPMSQDKPLVSVIMGSRSDWETLKAAAEILEELGVAFETAIVSAHRTPDRMTQFAREAEGLARHLLSMPDVGSDDDFEVSRDPARRVDL